MKKVIAPSREPLSSSDLEQESEKPVLAKPAPIRTEEEQEHQQFKWPAKVGATHIRTTAPWAMSSKIHSEGWMASLRDRLHFFWRLSGVGDSG
jgi:hypothetical protein